MEDPWKYVAFPSAAVLGYLFSLGVTTRFQAYLGISQFFTRLLVIAGAALVMGFIVDELVPAYIERARGGSGEDIGGELEGGDMDFG